MLTLLTLGLLAVAAVFCAGGYYSGYRLRLNDEFEAWMATLPSDTLFAAWLGETPSEESFARLAA